MDLSGCFRSGLCHSKVARFGTIVVTFHPKVVARKLISAISQKTYKSPEFETYDDAFEYCRQKTSDCYESSLLCRYRYEKFANFLKDGGNLLSSPSANLLLFSISLFLRKEGARVPHLIDFGGACGESIILLSKIFGAEIFLNSWVCESPAQVEESQNWEFAKNIQYASDLSQVVVGNIIDIFFTSGTIQSLSDPYEPLKTIAVAKIPIVALTRNNFSLNTKIVAQRSLLSGNGTGKHIDEYGNPYVYYPNTSVKKTKVMEIFLSQGYRILIDTSGNASGVYGSENFSGDIVFALI